MFIYGHDVVKDPILAKKALAYVPDDPNLFDNLTVWEHLRFIASAYRMATGWEAAGETLLKQFELTEKRNELTSALSRGMRQKVAICCGYLHEPRAILLDEPLTGLDPRGIRTMQESIRGRAEKGAAVMISSHLLSLVEDLCHSILLMNRGQVLLRGSLDDLKREAAVSGRQESLEDLFFRLTEGSPADPTVEPAVLGEMPAESNS